MSEYEGIIGDRSMSSWSARSPSDWDAADGGVGKRMRRISRKQEELRGSGEAKAWVKNSGTTSKQQHSPSTPTTAASSPSPERVGAIPPLYQETISTAFGPKADLYKLLNVSRHASGRDIRIAYFRRGRQVLTDTQQQKASSAAVTIGGVSEQSKLRFQAVSMAYEILSTPAWRAAYDKTGLANIKDDTYIPDSRSIPGSPVSQSSRRTGVRWNEEVEELVFDQDPSEFAVEEDSEVGVCGDESRPAKNSSKKKKKKKKKKRVVVEDDDHLLSEHLARLDEDAERDVFNDFLDDIEASIDGLLSFGSSSKGSTGNGEKKKKKKKERKRPPMPEMLEDYPSQPPVNSQSRAKIVTRSPRSPSPPPQVDMGFHDITRSLPDTSRQEALLDKERRSPSATIEESNASTPSHSTPTPAHSNVTKTPTSEGSRKERHQAGRHPRELELPDITREKQEKSTSSKKKKSVVDHPPKDIVINPENLEVQPPSDIVIKPRESKLPSEAPTPDFSSPDFINRPDYTNTPAIFDGMDDTISTISINTFGKRVATPTEQLLVDPPKIQKSPDTVFADVSGANVSDEDCPMDERQTSLDQAIDNAVDASSKKSDASMATPDIVFCSGRWLTGGEPHGDRWCTTDTQSTQPVINNSSTNSVISTPRKRRDGDSSSYSPIRRREPDSSDLASNFMHHFMAYVQALSNEVSKLGTVISEDPSSLFSSVMLNDDDLESFFGILETEMDRTPEDLSS